MSDEGTGEGLEAERPPEGTVEALFAADRAKAFFDAVVAIAMTLLILPLLDAVTSNSQARAGALPWLESHVELLVSFVLSFGVIAMFWINHHRMYARVHSVTTVLIWINVAWLATIVWLPVATALINESTIDNDVTGKVVYIGTMTSTSLIAFFQDLFLRAHPRLHDIPRQSLLRGTAASLATTVLFVVALALSILVPDVGYYWLLVLFLTGPMAMLFGRMLGVRPQSRRRDPGARRT